LARATGIQVGVRGRGAPGIFIIIFIIIFIFIIHHLHQSCVLILIFIIHRYKLFPPCANRSLVSCTPWCAPTHTCAMFYSGLVSQLMP
jgi:hypothetical protein